MGHLIQPDSMMPTPVRGADSTTPTHYSSTEGDAAASTSSRPSSPQSEVHGELGGLNDLQQQFAAYRFGDPGSSETNFGQAARRAASDKYKQKGVPSGLAPVLGTAEVAIKLGLRAGQTIKDSAGLQPVRGKTAETVRKMSTGNAWAEDFQTGKINRDRQVIEQRKGSLPNIEALEGDPGAERVRVPRKGSLASARDSVDVTTDRWINGRLGQFPKPPASAKNTEQKSFLDMDSDSENESISELVKQFPEPPSAVPTAPKTLPASAKNTEQKSFLDMDSDSVP
jgi:hypothetical protein